MIGGRQGKDLIYPVDETALKHDAGVDGRDARAQGRVRTVSAGRRTRLPRRRPAGLLGAQVEAELGRCRLELAQGARLELAHPLARDAELGADVLERA